MQIRVTAPIYEYGCVQLVKGEILHIDDATAKRLLRTGSFVVIAKGHHTPQPEITLPHAETAVLPRTYGPKPKPPAKPKGK